MSQLFSIDPISWDKISEYSIEYKEIRLIECENDCIPLMYIADIKKWK